MRVLISIVAFVVGIGACGDEAVKVAETIEREDVPGGGDGETLLDVDEPEAGLETTPEVEVDEGCRGDGECAGLGGTSACAEAKCIERVCTLVPADGKACDDGNACTEDDVCRGAICGGSAVVCEGDDNPCTDEVCNPASGQCETTDNSAPCSDGLACTSGDVCRNGACSGAPVACADDGNPCTDHGCNPATGQCEATNNTAACSDGDACSRDDVCSDGACVGRAVVCVDDGNPCTDNACNPTTGQCAATNNSAACSDGFPCTSGDVCSGGSCAGTPVVCPDDGNPCTDHACNSGTGQCQTTNNSASCSDDNLCTTGDMCRAGVCTTTGVLTCPALEPSATCYVPACLPTTGCGRAPAPLGTTCDNGAGIEPGSCRLGGYLEDDACNGQGSCVDATEVSPDPTDRDLLGTWFAVHTSFGRTATPSTARAVLAVDPNSPEFVVKAAQANGATPFVNGVRGYYCAPEDGTFEGRLGSGVMLGHQLDEELAVVVDPATDGVTVALRAQGSSTQVNGRYLYYQTTIVSGSTSPTTWIGAAQFNAGCLVSGTFLTDPTVAGTYDFVTTPTDCLAAATTADEAGLYRLSTHAKAQVGDPTSYPIDFRGAIGKNGDIVLMVKEVAGTVRPEFGILLLLRAPTATSTIGAPPYGGEWAYTLQSKLGGDLPRRDYGTLFWTNNGTIDGDGVTTIEGTSDITGGWYKVDGALQGFSQRLDLGGLVLYQAGFPAKAGRFAVGWTVKTPPNGTTATELDKGPRYGSTLFMLRP